MQSNQSGLVHHILFTIYNFLPDYKSTFKLKLPVRVPNPISDEWSSALHVPKWTRRVNRNKTAPQALPYRPCYNPPYLTASISHRVYILQIVPDTPIFSPKAHYPLAATVEGTREAPAAVKIDDDCKFYTVCTRCYE